MGLDPLLSQELDMAKHVGQRSGGITTDSAHRTVTTADGATVLSGSTFKNAVSPLNCFGADVIVVSASHSGSGDSISVVLAFYDRDDNFLGCSTVLELEPISSSLTAQVLDSSGSANSRYVSEDELDVPAGAFKARAVVTAQSGTSTDIHLATVDAHLGR